MASHKSDAVYVNLDESVPLDSLRLQSQTGLRATLQEASNKPHPTVRNFFSFNRNVVFFTSDFHVIQPFVFSSLKWKDSKGEEQKKKDESITIKLNSRSKNLNKNLSTVQRMFQHLLTWSSPSNSMAGFHGLLSDDGTVSFKLNTFYGTHYLGMEYIGSDFATITGGTWEYGNLREELHGKWVNAQLAFSVTYGYQLHSGKVGISARLIKLRILLESAGLPKSKVQVLEETMDKIPFGAPPAKFESLKNREDKMDHDDDDADDADDDANDDGDEGEKTVLHIADPRLMQFIDENDFAGPFFSPEQETLL